MKQIKTGTRICILTSSHYVFDGRIFHRQAKCLAKAGYDITMIAPHPADEVTDGIKVKAVAVASSKFERLLVTPLHVLVAAIREKCDIYHFHDPELVPYGLLLRLLGRKVIYDAHEYYRLKLESRTGIPSWLRGFAARAFDLFETAASRFFNGVIVADVVTEGKFNGRAVHVSSYPYLPSGSGTKERPESDGTFRCVYAGSITAERGLFKMVEAMGYVERSVRLALIGGDREDQLKISTLKGYEKVDWLGYMPWPEVMEFLPGCDLGLVLLQPTPAYLYAGENTIKLFEYMSAGLPVLGSNFRNLERIIKETGCGVTVDPTDPVEIARKITAFADDPVNAKRMGANGRRAVLEKYNWEVESGNLLGLYDRILAGAK